MIKSEKYIRIEKGAHRIFKTAVSESFVDRMVDTIEIGYYLGGASLQLGTAMAAFTATVLSLSLNL